MELDKVTADHFEPHLGTEFEIHFEGGDTVVLQLDKVRRASERVAKQAQEAGFREPFSLEFIGARDIVLQQAVYRISHTVLGEFDLFLVPVGPVDGGLAYNVAIN